MSKSYSVYRHTSPSGKVYIGITSVSPNKRWRGGHGYTHGFCTLFSNAIKKYGWDNIKHEILLDGCSKEEAVYAEKYLVRWYKIHSISYNITDGGDLGGSLTGKDHPMYGRHETNPMYGIRGGDNPNAIKVYQYDRDGHFIKEWKSITEAAATFDNKGATATGITQCCKHRLPACKGYIWRYFYVDNLEEKAPIHTKHVYQYDVEGNLVSEYNKINDVLEVFDIPKSRLGIISSCCKGKAVSGLGYFWSNEKLEKYPVSDVKPQVLTKMKKYIKEKQINQKKK
jgi:hypothetical protein